MLGCANRQHQRLIPAGSTRQIQRRSHLVPGIHTARVGGIPLFHRIIRRELHFLRFAQRSRILGIIVHNDLRARLTIVIDPLCIRTGKPYAAKRSGFPQQVKLLPLHISGILRVVWDRVKHDPLIEPHCIMTVGAIHHQSPLVIIARLECPERCLVPFPPAGADKCLDRHQLPVARILFIYGHAIRCAVYHDHVRRF